MTQRPGGDRRTAGPLEIVLDRETFPRRVFTVQLGIAALFVLLDATINWGRLIDVRPIRRLFNVAREHSLSNWYSSTQTLGVGIVLWLIATQVYRSGAPKLRARGWILVACFFTYMAIDDGAAIHERVGSAVKYLYGSSGVVRRYPSYEWQLAMGPFFAAMGALMFALIWKEITSPRLRALFLCGLSCYVTKVGIDFVEGIAGYDVTIATALGDAAYAKAVSHFQRVIEELIKMVGTAFFMRTFLTYLMTLAPGVHARFTHVSGRLRR